MSFVALFVCFVFLITGSGHISFITLHFISLWSLNLKQGPTVCLFFMTLTFLKSCLSRKNTHILDLPNCSIMIQFRLNTFARRLCRWSWVPLALSQEDRKGRSPTAPQEGLRGSAKRQELGNGYSWEGEGNSTERRACSVVGQRGSQLDRLMNCCWIYWRGSLRESYARWLKWAEWCVGGNKMEMGA